MSIPARKKGDAASAVGEGVDVKLQRRKARDLLVLMKKDIANFVGLPQEEAAGRLGISTTTLKKVCRKIGIVRWPYGRGQQKARSSTAEPHTVLGANVAVPADTFPAVHTRQYVEARLSCCQDLCEFKFHLDPQVERFKPAEIGQHNVLNEREFNGEEAIMMEDDSEDLSWLVHPTVRLTGTSLSRPLSLV